MKHSEQRAPRKRPTIVTALTAVVALATSLLVASTAEAVTTGNGSLVYAPPNGSSFNDEGGDATGTAYAKILSLKYNGGSNGQLIVTFDDARLIQDVSPSGNPTTDTTACIANPALACHQEWPIFRSTDGGSSWTKITSIRPDLQFPGTPGLEDSTQLDRLAQPFLYELPVATGGLAAGTLLFAGQIRPADRDHVNAVSKLVLYKSTNQGTSWTYVSTIDTGGPAVYDPSPSSTTTPVWEPTLAVDANGGLVAYFSDERQKGSGILQAVSYRRSTNGGTSWGSVVNVVAPTDSLHRPGMITVDKLPDGTYIATYEIVNAAGYAGSNASPVFFKKSADGLNWGTASSLGTPVELANGQGIGSSPYVKWVPTGGPKGMVIVASKWGLDAAGNVTTGQNFFVNYNLGAGPWERLPFAVTFNGPSSITGFAQGLDYSSDGRTLFQATNVDNYRTGYLYNDIRVGTIPLNSYIYEAEKAAVANASLVSHADASNGSKVGNINLGTSTVTFTVKVPTAGSYTMNVRYANGTGATSGHSVSVNGGSGSAISYPATADWGRYLWAQKSVSLNAGSNTIRFTYSGTFTELDQIQLYQTSVTPAPEFQLKNRNSSKLLEIPSSSLADGTDAVQRGSTGLATQRWNMAPNAAGFWIITNANSTKLLEITSCSVADGGIAQQWGPTGALCQEWALVREGIQ